MELNEPYVVIICVGYRALGEEVKWHEFNAFILHGLRVLHAPILIGEVINQISQIIGTSRLSTCLSTLFDCSGEILQYNFEMRIRNN